MKNFEFPMKKMAAALSSDAKYGPVTCAYLEINSPSIPEAIDECVRQGAKEIRLMPYFLLIGRHVKSDIPAIVKAARQKYRGICRILVSPYLGYDKHILAVVKKRILQAK